MADLKKYGIILAVALGAIYLANRVDMVKKIVGPKV
jgi:hypothetical protein